MITLFDQDFWQKHTGLQEQFKNIQTKHGLTKATFNAFNTIIEHYYTHNKRIFSWRTHITPYNVAVSEIMLQQTQTDRVVIKFDPFIAQFPTWQSLAQANFHDVLRMWKGLGYNRRALALHKIANLVVSTYNGILPDKPEILVTFPGIGKATAHSIITFAFNNPSIFIETNIRTVFIYFFFQQQTNITDKEIAPLIEHTLNHENPREWYYALMDYGAMLKKTVGNLSRFSAHYHKQSPFEGSERQLRGKILQTLLDKPGTTEQQLVTDLKDTRIKKVLQDLALEGFIKHNHKTKTKLQLITKQTQLE